MKQAVRSGIVLLISSLLLTGCWNLRTIQDIYYATAIGFDYKDGKYIVHAQMIDFMTVAKSETGKPTEPIAIWVGTGRGDTPIDAYNDLYRSSQLRIFYGQINAVVVSENLMKERIYEISELPRRYFEMRYTPWVFGTKLPIDKIFSVTPLFNLSPLASILHQPQESYKQLSMIAPITMREFFSSYPEPARTTLFPSLTIENNNWKSDMKPSEKLEIDGIFAFQHERYLGWFDIKQLSGLRWVERQTVRSPVLLQNGETNIASVSLEKPKVRITPQWTAGSPRFRVHVKLRGIISEMMEQTPERELEKLAEDLIKHELTRTYKLGLEKDADLLQLEDALYRKKNRQWKRWKQEGDGKLHDDSLAEVDVKVNIVHKGKLKN